MGSGPSEELKEQVNVVYWVLIPLEAALPETKKGGLYAEKPMHAKLINWVFCWAAGDAPRLLDYPINSPSAHCIRVGAVGWVSLRCPREGHDIPYYRSVIRILSRIMGEASTLKVRAQGLG